MTKLLVNSIALSVGNIFDFYKKKPPEAVVFLQAFNNQFFTRFWQYTGFDTGYGFFAPNVASNFIIVHAVEFKGGNKKLLLSDYPFTTKEGKLRFTMLNQLFMDRVMDNKKTYYDKYLSVLLKRINLTVPVDNAVCEMTTTLYLYDYQQLSKYKKAATFKLYSIDMYTSNYK